MRVITNRHLLEFSAVFKDSRDQLQAWRKILESKNFKNFAELKQIFNSVDKVSDLTIFNICGNKYRLIAFIQYEKQLCFIKQVLTHTAYDKRGWKR